MFLPLALPKFYTQHLLNDRISVVASWSEYVQNQKAQIQCLVGARHNSSAIPRPIAGDCEVRGRKSIHKIKICISGCGPITAFASNTYRHNAPPIHVYLDRFKSVPGALTLAKLCLPNFQIHLEIVWSDSHIPIWRTASKIIGRRGAENAHQTDQLSG